MNKTVYALVDANSFYCSCERVFRPDLASKPVIVLSNNDGCAVSRTDEAKHLGIEIGAVYFQVKDLIKKHDIQVFSSNYTLYGNMSARVMQILSTFAPEMEIYSIDEAFLSLSGMEKRDLASYAIEIKNTVLQYTGIPTCVGLGPTKVLSKVANRLAKKDKIKTQSVFNLCDEDFKIKTLKTFPVEDIWGIGKQSAKKLYAHQIKTAYELMIARPEIIKKLLSIVGLKIANELNGQNCFNLETDLKDRKQIISSRSFGKQVTHIDQLKEAIANHVTNAAEKLRSQKLLCKNVTVFIQTNPFKTHSEQYFNSASINLMSGTSVTPKLIHHAFNLLESIYKDKYEYKKAGVIFNDLIKKDFIQTDFFENYDTQEQDHYMATLDKINQKFGKSTVRFAACGVDQHWKMLSQMKSPHFTTRWNDLLKIK